MNKNGTFTEHQGTLLASIRALSFSFNLKDCTFRSMTSCCEPPTPQNHESCAPKGGVDGLLYGTLAVILVALAVHLTGLHVPVLSDFAHAVAAMMKAIWGGIAAGIVAVGLMNKVPREYFNALLGSGQSHLPPNAEAEQ